jgi:hypothetical protein
LRVTTWNWVPATKLNNHISESTTKLISIPSTQPSNLMTSSHTYPHQHITTLSYPILQQRLLWRSGQ